MSKRLLELFVFDILIAICKINFYIKDIKNADELQNDLRTWDSVIRELEIIGEASKYLVKSNLLGENSKKITDFRNVLIHEYFGIDKEIVWDVLKNKLPLLKNELENIVYSLPFEISNEIINKLIEEYYKFPFITEMLKELQNRSKYLREEE